MLELDEEQIRFQAQRLCSGAFNRRMLWQIGAFTRRIFLA
jgi:hypothetical protein